MSNTEKVAEPNSLYKLQTDIVQMEEFLVGKDTTKVKKLTMKTYDNLLKSLSKGKSPDIMGSQVEHFLYAPSGIKVKMMECINEILGDTKLYISPTFAVSLGCSLFLKCALYFTGIEACSWVTVRSLKILDFVYFVIEKNTPRSRTFAGKTVF